LACSSRWANGYVEEKFNIGSAAEEIMETPTYLLYIVAGLFLRLAIPVLGTALLVFFLRKLDKRWQAEAERVPMVDRPECWKIRGCTAEETENCAAYTSKLPCWQVYRLPNGYLHEECLSCQVFTEAPIPTLKTEPRRL
jgi:hypothetical protein